MTYLVYGQQGSCSRLVERIFLHGGCRGGLSYFKGFSGRPRPKRLEPGNDPYVCKYDTGMYGRMPRFKRLLKTLRKHGPVCWVILDRPVKFGGNFSATIEKALIGADKFTAVNVGELLKTPGGTLKAWSKRFNLDFTGFPETIYDADRKYEA